MSPHPYPYYPSSQQCRASTSTQSDESQLSNDTNGTFRGPQPIDPNNNNPYGQQIPNNPSENVIKCVFVGDGAVGKTSLIVSYTTNGYPHEYVPTAFDNYSVVVRVDNQPIRMQLCDTAGQNDFDSLRPLCYPSTDVFLLCFSVVSPTSFYNLDLHWINELKQHSPQTPIILVGTQIDLRNNIQVRISLNSQGECPVLESEGHAYAKEIGAELYIECSALTQQKLKDVFDAAILVAMKSRERRYRSRSQSSDDKVSVSSFTKRMKDKLARSNSNSERHELSVAVNRSTAFTTKSPNATPTNQHRAATAKVAPNSNTKTQKSSAKAKLPPPVLQSRRRSVVMEKRMEKQGHKDHHNDSKEHIPYPYGQQYDNGYTVTRMVATKNVDQTPYEPRPDYGVPVSNHHRGHHQQEPMHKYNVVPSPLETSGTSQGSAGSKMGKLKQGWNRLVGFAKRTKS